MKNVVKLVSVTLLVSGVMFTSCRKHGSQESAVVQDSYKPVVVGEASGGDQPPASLCDIIQLPTGECIRICGNCSSDGNNFEGSINVIDCNPPNPPLMPGRSFHIVGGAGNWQWGCMQNVEYPFCMGPEIFSIVGDHIDFIVDELKRTGKYPCL